MRYIADDFIEETKRQNIFCKEIENKESLEIRQNIEKKYSKSGDGALWERINIENFGFHAPNNKTIVNKLNIKGEIILFFEKSTDKTMFRLKNIQDVMSIITELFGFVFYITNKDTSFLLCWNDHEFVIGAGQAKKWIEDLKISITK